jgi:photoactive yellow protein
MELLTFGSDNIENILASMTDEQVDALAFGAIRLDAAGTVLQYNATEADITGRQVEEVLGKNFFMDVAPCTNRSEFKGRFDEGIQTGYLNAIFEYVFDYQMQPTRVKVHMKKGMADQHTWVFVKRL